jgi:hypothetical protein
MSTDRDRQKCLCAAAEKLVAMVFENTPKLIVQIASGQQLVAICLHGTVLELCGACISLIRSGDHVGVPILLRSLIEAFVDLRILVKEPTYLDSMQVAYLADSKRVLGDLTKGFYDGTGIGDGVPFDKLQEHLNKSVEELHSLRQKGTKPLDTRERFTRARLKSYMAVYWMQSQDTHNNLRALQRRHISTEDDSTRVQFFRRQDFDWAAGQVHLLADIVTGSLDEVAALVGVTDSIQGQRLQDQKRRVLSACYPNDQQGEAGR